MNFNKVILAGNLTRDPEVRYTPKGLAIARFGLAINRTWKNEAGETKEEVTFVDVDSFGRTAEVLQQYMKKGSAILLEGRLKLDTWEDKQTGQKRQALKVLLETFQFGDRKNSGQQQPTSAPAAGAPKSPANPEPAEPEEDDVPF